MTLPFRRRHHDQELTHDRAHALISTELIEPLTEKEQEVIVSKAHPAQTREASKVPLPAVRFVDVTEQAGIKFQLTLPSVAFNRAIGEFRNVHASPEGQLLSDGEWAARKDEWLPSKDDGAFIESLMQPCWERGKYAGWISAPKVGIDSKPGDFEYVKIAVS